jgi:RIO kinase 1
MKINEQLIDDLFWDDEDGYPYLPPIKGVPQKRGSILKGNPPSPHRKIATEFQEQSDTLRAYEFTYGASRHEEWWLLDSLGSFFDEQWFDDVLQIVKGGKEASVYLCQANATTGTDLLAAKVYRPRSLRNLRKDYIYREGRTRLDSDGLEIIDERQSRAMNRRTEYGQELMHTSWIEHEFRTLQLLHKAGCDVPTPYASDHNAILMDYIGDWQMAASTLNGIRLPIHEARILFDRVMHNLKLMLSNERVHGDLSAYNILYWDGEITLIDFPQAINPNRNPNAYPIFQRDITRICEYFISQGMELDPEKLAEGLWTAHHYSTAPNILWEDEGFDDDSYDDPLYG